MPKQNPDITNLDVRMKIISEILSQENEDRKEEHLKRFEIYKKRQGRFIVQKLKEEFSNKTVDEMRKILSINLTTRIVNEKASIYKDSPERTFSELNEKQTEQVENLYKFSKANVKFKHSNRYFELSDQCALQVIPSDGIVELRPLLPFQYDVIPDAKNPEKAFCYVLSVFDKFEFIAGVGTNSNSTNKLGTESDKLNRVSDGINQTIGDKDDYKSQINQFIFWTDEHSFKTDRFGTLIPLDEPSEDGTIKMENAIGKLPFIDIAGEKIQEFFVREGNNVVEFSLDFGVLLSDTANINRLQGYAQAIISSEKLPQNLVIGPNHVIHLKQDREAPELDPRFEFVSPSIDIAGSLDLLSTYLRLFLSAENMDPKTVSGKAEVASFSSGIEKLLSMIEKFEASLDTIDLFRDVEDKAYELLKLWSNVMQGVDENGLRKELRLAKIPEESNVSVNFSEPGLIQTRSDLEDSNIKLIGERLKSRVEAIMELRSVDKDRALEIIVDIDKASGVVLPQVDPNEEVKDIS